MPTNAVKPSIFFQSLSVFFLTGILLLSPLSNVSCAYSGPAPHTHNTKSHKMAPRSLKRANLANRAPAGVKARSSKWKSTKRAPMRRSVAKKTVAGAPQFRVAYKVVKDAPEAKIGCFKNLSYEDALLAVKRFHLNPLNGDKDEVIALAKGLIWIEVLNGGNPLREAQNKTYAIRSKNNQLTYEYPVRWINLGEKETVRVNGRAVSKMITTASQTAGGLRILRNRGYGSNVAQLLHELGHLVGNQGYYSKYNSFKSRSGIGYCVVSGYSHTKNPARRASENWAEIFASFTTVPRLILNNKSVACEKTWEFFEQTMFPQGEAAKTCGTIEGEKLAKQRILAARNLPLAATGKDPEQDEQLLVKNNDPAQQVSPADEHDHSDDGEEDESDISEDVVIEQNEAPATPETVVSTNSGSSKELSNAKSSANANSNASAINNKQSSTTMASKPQPSATDSANKGTAPNNETNSKNQTTTTNSKNASIDSSKTQSGAVSVAESVYRPSQRCLLNRGDQATNAELIEIKLGGAINQVAHSHVLAELKVLREDHTPFTLSMESAPEGLNAEASGDLEDLLSWNYQSVAKDFLIGGSAKVAQDWTQGQLLGWVASFVPTSFSPTGLRMGLSPLKPLLSMSFSMSPDKSLLRLSFQGIDFGDQRQELNPGYLMQTRTASLIINQQIDSLPLYQANDCSFIKIATPQ